MKLRAELLKNIQLFLVSVPPKTLKRGRGYFRSGAVLEMECVEPNRLFVAVVRGGEDYEVRLNFGKGGWDGECSCPIGYDCKHIVAAMMALQQEAGGGDKNNFPARQTFANTQEQIVEAINLQWHKVKGIPAPAKKKSRVSQPPPSPLRDKLMEKLGRELTRQEADYVRQVQTAFAETATRHLAESDLGALSQHSAFTSFNYWQKLELWPEPPRDDFYFWQFIAWELNRRDWKFPPFMDGVTDLSLIEPAMKNWEREKEIEKWHGWFRQFDDHAPVSNPGVLELRLAVWHDEACLQWRMGSQSDFTALKQSQAKKFGEQFEKGALTLAPDSLPLWSATYKPWHYESWWTFKYANAAARPALNRMLRMPLSPDRVIGPDGQPLPRPAEPLRLELRRCGTEASSATESDDDHYELALVTADGSSAPKIFCALQGHPTLYLTERGLFAGPAADLLDTDSRKLIPAPALETAAGLRFLHAAEVPLPEHLARRVRTVPVNITISCDLKFPYPGSRSEDIVISVTAKAPGMKKEHFTPEGWRTEYESFARATSKSNGHADRATIAIHDRAAQKHFPRVLESLPDLKHGGYLYNWSLRLTKKTPEVFVAWLKSLPPEIEVLLDKELATLRDEPVSGDVSLDVTEAGIDWFDLKVALNMSDSTLTPEELKLLLNARGGYVRLGKKGWRRLQFNLTPEEDEQLARLGLDARDFSAEPQRFHALQLADDAAKKFLAPERVEKIQRRVGELKARVAPPLPQTIRAEMRPYQMDGFHFLAYLTANRFGGVLADDMGLGKTLQTLAWLAWLRESPPASDASNGVAPSEQGMDARQKCSLVVCPKSVMDNWRAEAERFFPQLRVRLWRGEAVEELSDARQNSDLIVVNYAQLRALSPGIDRLPWMGAILDEAQYIKNPDSQTAHAARALQAEHRLALTGTPIENRLLDLWSIFGFAMPGALGNRTHFLRRFNAKDDPLARRRLAARVRPFLLRRAKSQVARDLPDRVEEDLLCEMEGEQKTLYRAELKRARQILLKLKTSQQLNDERFNILTSLLRLRQICCHPALVNEKLREAESAKVSALEDLLEPLMEEGHKVLVFSQFVTMLDLLREKIKARDWPHFYLAGDTENRGELVKEFQSANGSAVFLISLKAGGFGLNLTAASYVVLFDPWWNPAVENQAIDRTHRIGQTSKVMAYRLLMRESIEEKIRALQKQKAALAGDVLGEERFAQSLTLDDLRFLFAE